ncbi:MAG: hypothetical protein SGARI_007439, partial [Bacillariaceae sp.]
MAHNDTLDDDCHTISSSNNYEESVVNLLSAFDDLYADSAQQRHIPSVASFLANLEDQMAMNNSSSSRGQWEDDNDDDSLVLTRNRGIPAMKVASEEDGDDSSLSDDSEVYIVPLKDVE